MGICPENGVQTNLLDYDPVRYEKLKRLDEVIDRINRENGRETIVLGSQQYTAKDGKGKAGVFRDSIKRNKHANGKVLDGKIVQQMPE